MRKKDVVQEPTRLVAPRGFRTTVARTLLKFVAKDGRVDQRTGRDLKIQLDSAIQVRFGVATSVEDMSGLLPNELLEVQEVIRSAIEAIRRGEPMIPLVKIGPIEFIELGISRNFRSPHLLHASWLLPDPRAAFWMGVAVALEQSGDLIQECERTGCHSLYVRLGGQKYCSKGCGQRDRSARHYQAHRDEVLDRRHEAYARAKRKHQPRARVQRRRRST